MKKNIFYSALFAATLTLGFTSCSSNDDEENVIGEEDVIKTQDDVYALINGAYRPYQALSSTFTSMVDTPTELGTSYLGNEEDDVTKMVELKYDKSAQTAIDQIKQKNYGRIFRDYKGDVLVVGINYDKDTKEHQCLIEKLRF